jgi:hypothetical protein
MRHQSSHFSAPGIDVNGLHFIQFWLFAAISIAAEEPPNPLAIPIGICYFFFIGKIVV